MSTFPRKDTRPELELRKLLHASGLRYRVQYPVPGRPRRTVDVAFTRLRVAIFIDGCFWHGCPDHGSVPSSNTQWWTVKLGATKARDADTCAVLRATGWDVLRLWEHEPAEAMAAAAMARLDARRGPRPDVVRAPGT